jgi:hypothetical protein
MLGKDIQRSIKDDTAVTHLDAAWFFLDTVVQGGSLSECMPEKSACWGAYMDSFESIS